ncbi:MAG: hypothetical protein IJD97_03360 [Clostridia bacterium]|nr:hypothetical protein [Clostridia bacterium]
MAFCEKCGVEIEEGLTLCTECKAKADPAETVKETVDNILDTPDTTGSFASEDIQQNKVMAVLAYLGILVLIPILAAPKSAYARYHANQGLVLWITEIILSVVSAILAFIPFIGTIIGTILSAILLILAIIGIVNAATGKAKELPLIGKIKILK